MSVSTYLENARCFTRRNAGHGRHPLCDALIWPDQVHLQRGVGEQGQCVGKDSNKLGVISSIEHNSFLSNLLKHYFNSTVYILYRLRFLAGPQSKKKQIIEEKEQYKYGQDSSTNCGNCFVHNKNCSEVIIGKHKYKTASTYTIVHRKKSSYRSTGVVSVVRDVRQESHCLFELHYG